MTCSEYFGNDYMYIYIQLDLNVYIYIRIYTNNDDRISYYSPQAWRRRPAAKITVIAGTPRLTSSRPNVRIDLLKYIKQNCYYCTKLNENEHKRNIK